MSMSTHILGFKPADEKWRAMKAVYDACDNAGIATPDDVLSYFQWEKPDESGVTVDIQKHPSVKLYKADMENGFEVDLTKLPKDVTVLRFYNSY